MKYDYIIDDIKPKAKKFLIEQFKDQKGSYIDCIKEYIDAYFLNKDLDGSFIIEGKFSRMDDLFAHTMYMICFFEEVKSKYRIIIFSKEDAENYLEKGNHLFSDLIEDYQNSSNIN